MKKNEQLLNIIGDVNEKYVSDKIITKKRKSPLTIAAIGSAACAAVIAGVFITHNIALTNRQNALWAQYPIFPETNSYYTSSETTSGDLEKITCVFGNMIDKELVNYAQFHESHDFAELNAVNPWFEADGVTSLPVFKNLSYGGKLTTPTYYLTDNQLMTMAENAAKLLELEIIESEYKSVGATDQGQQPRYCLAAKCGGEKFGVEFVEISAYSDGELKVDFMTFNLSPNNDNDIFGLPDEYSCTVFDTSQEEAEKTIEYLYKNFKNIIQIDNPVITTYISGQFRSQNDDGSPDERLYSRRAYCLYENSDDIVEKILNYNFKIVSFSAAGEGVGSISISNRLTAARYMGNYPLITQERAQALLLNGTYLNYISTDELKNQTLNEEDIKNVDLVYCKGDNMYYAPYYRFFVELERPPFLDEDMLEYGLFYVPAIEEEYFEIPKPENDPTYFMSYHENNDSDDRFDVSAAFPDEGVYFPDGTEVVKEDAILKYENPEKASEPVLMFDWSYLRPTGGLFKNTIDDPDSYDFDAQKWTDEIEESIGEVVEGDYIKVQQDMLMSEKLTVSYSEIQMSPERADGIFRSDITLSGELTCEGILKCDYDAETGRLTVMTFFPDPASSDSRLLLGITSKDSPKAETFVDGDVAILAGGGIYDLGCYNWNGENVFDEIERETDGKRYVKAKITMSEVGFTIDNTYDHSSIIGIVEDYEILS